MKKYSKIISYSHFKFLIIFIFSILCMSNPSVANELLNGLPALNVNTDGDKTEYSLPLQILILMGALTILPSLVLGMTSFTRIIIVMSILRQALGTQQTPPNQVIIAISLFLTFFIMSPTLTKIYNEAATPYMNNEVSAEVAVDKASKSIKNNGLAILIQDINDAHLVANYIAPEHLEIMTKNRKVLAKKITNAGAIFMGKYTPESFGDYVAGPSHVLPTSGNARFESGLSVLDFLKRTSYIEANKVGLKNTLNAIEVLGNSEGLDAHVKSAKIRFSKE